MANPDRLTALDSTFLHLEDHSTAHMHVASVMVFEGKAPSPRRTGRPHRSRLHLVPRYRQRLAYVPLGQGRPVWADDPHFNPRYHIRHTALPKPADDEALKQLAGRALLAAPGPLQAAVGDLARREDGGRPLRADRQDPPRAGRRHLGRRHHDGAVRHGAGAGADLAPAEPWSAQAAARARPSCSARRCVERTTVPGEMVRGARALLRAPRRAASQLRRRPRRASARRRSRGSQRRRRRARSTSTIGPHRRYTFVDADLDRFKAIKDSLGGTLNDVVLATVSARASAATCAREGDDTEGLELKAMVPVSVRADGRARRARQSGRGDVGAAARRRAEPGRVRWRRSPRRWRT